MPKLSMLQHDTGALHRAMLTLQVPTNSNCSVHKPMSAVLHNVYERLTWSVVSRST